MNDIPEDKPTGLEELFNKLKEYAETRLALMKLIAINKSSGFFSTFVTMLILLMIFFTVIFCVSIGLALLIGEWVGGASYGFFIVAGFYLILGLILFANRGRLLKTPVSNKLIKEMVE